MNKISLILFVAFFNVVLFSCSPQSNVNDEKEELISYGEDDHIPPTPPPGGD